MFEYGKQWGLCLALDDTDFVSAPLLSPRPYTCSCSPPLALLLPPLLPGGLILDSICPRVVSKGTSILLPASVVVCSGVQKTNSSAMLPNHHRASPSLRGIGLQSMSKTSTRGISDRRRYHLDSPSFSHSYHSVSVSSITDSNYEINYAPIYHSTPSHTYTSNT